MRFSYLLLTNVTGVHTLMCGFGKVLNLNFVGSLYPSPKPIISPFTGTPTGESIAALSFLYLATGNPESIEWKYRQ